MKSKEVIFIADFFRKDLLGGAESNDSVLISRLESKGFRIEKIRSTSVSPELILKNKDKNFIISNFVGLSKDSIDSLINSECKYTIYEHDHKYVSSRDPSVFANYDVPESKIINKRFYECAHSVVVLSNICKEVIEKNLKLTNVHSIGCSLWAKEKFSLLRDLAKNKKADTVVLQSNNPTKGTSAAENVCKSKNIEYKLISSPDEKQFLTMLSKAERLVFIPQVLETFCRLVAEAKMLGCKVLTKTNLLGFASEECFSLSGEELINEMSKRVDAAVELFVKILKEESIDSPDNITTILNCYRRPHLLKQQIDAIKNQTVQSDEIWIWVNDSEENRNYDFEELKGVKVFKCDHNWKFYGRFAAAMLADTKYVAMFDDDTMPGEKWFENCTSTMKTNPGILGGVGCLISGNKYYGHQRVGWSNPNDETVEVDLVGHAWFFKREHLQYLWREKPQTWDNGEDIQFSYLAQKYGNIRTFVPPHPKEDKSMFSSLQGFELGVDDVATSNSRNHEVFYKQRDDCVGNAILNGWKPVRSRT